jgi:hypothetical protein
MKIKNNIALSESGFIFNPNTGESFTLNPAGMEIFGMIREEKNNDEILDVILEKYDISKDLAEKDLDDFIHHLDTYQIIDSDE